VAAGTYADGEVDDEEHNIDEGNHEPSDREAHRQIRQVDAQRTHYALPVPLAAAPLARVAPIAKRVRARDVQVNEQSVYECSDVNIENN